MFKKAFTLIEIIIAIVIIGIAVMTLPLMSEQANKADEFAINQDMFFKSMTVMEDIRSKYWDNTIHDRDMDGNGSCIVEVSTGDNKLDRNGTTNNYRVGSFLRGTKDYRKFYDYNLSEARTSADTKGLDGLVSASAILAGYSITEYNATEQYNGYKSDESGDRNVSVKILSAVAYVNDIPTSSTGNYESYSWSLRGVQPSSQTTNETTNVKRITVTASRKTSGSTTDTNVSFVLFSSNIGSQDLKWK